MARKRNPADLFEETPDTLEEALEAFEEAEAFEDGTPDAEAFEAEFSRRLR